MAHPRSELRAYVVDRAGYRCEWPGCPLPGSHMAHISGIGMGGRKTADDPGNVLFLCIPHHDQYDGRAPYTSTAWAALLAAAFPPNETVTDDGKCRWPDCISDAYEAGLCYEHVLLTTPEPPRPGRKQAAASILRQHVARLRVARGEEAS